MTNSTLRVQKIDLKLMSKWQGVVALKSFCNIMPGGWVDFYELKNYFFLKEKASTFNDCYSE